MNRYEIGVTDIYAIGDLHGYYDSLINWIKVNDITESAIIVCGDVGFGFEKRGYYEQLCTKFEHVCAERNVTVFMLRGNHDDPSYFNGENRIDSDHLKSIPDYSVISNGEHNILCIGGAVSVDRFDRIAEMRGNACKYLIHHNCPISVAMEKIPKIYWEDEKPYLDDDALDELALNGIMIDVVCTHDAPQFCPPITKDGIEALLEKDERLSEDVDESRSIFSEILAKLILDSHPVSKWIYAHYHHHEWIEIDGVEYVMLDMYRVNNNRIDFKKI